MHAAQGGASGLVRHEKSLVTTAGPQRQAKWSESVCTTLLASLAAKTSCAHDVCTYVYAPIRQASAHAFVWIPGAAAGATATRACSAAHQTICDRMELEHKIGSTGMQ